MGGHRDRRRSAPAPGGRPGSRRAPRRRRSPRRAGGGGRAPSGVRPRRGAHVGRRETGASAPRSCPDRRRRRRAVAPRLSTGSAGSSTSRRWWSVRRRRRSSRTELGPTRSSRSRTTSCRRAGLRPSRGRRRTRPTDARGAGRGAARGEDSPTSAVGAVEARALEHHADGVEHLAQPAAADGADGEGVVGEALELLELVVALGAAVLVGGQRALSSGRAGRGEAGTRCRRLPMVRHRARACLEHDRTGRRRPADQVPPSPQGWAEGGSPRRSGCHYGVLHSHNVGDYPSFHPGSDPGGGVSAG